MSESGTESSNVARDALGIAIFALAAFATISVAMSIWRPVDGTGRGVARAVELLVAAIGVAPLLTFTLGLTLLGAGVWLFSRTASFARDLAGLAGLALGLSVLLGAATADGGGQLGALTGAKVTAFLSLMVGVPFGLACVLLPAWLAWGRAPAANSANLGQDSVRPAVAPASEVEGVSPAEAEALLPRVPPRIDHLAAPPSPYPPDVRLQGRIPDGTRPIYLDDDARLEAPADPDLAAALLEEPAQGLEAAARPAGEDLARPDAAFLAEEAEPAAAAQAHGKLADHAGLREGARVITEADRPRPSWEQAELFEEPVDAYGTPLSILRSHRGDGAHSSVVDPPDLPVLAEIPLAERLEDGAPLGSAEELLPEEALIEEAEELAGELEEDEDLADDEEAEDEELDLLELAGGEEAEDEGGADEEDGEPGVDGEAEEEALEELARAEERASQAVLDSEEPPVPAETVAGVVDGEALESPVRASWEEGEEGELPLAEALETEPLFELEPQPAPGPAPAPAAPAGGALAPEELVRRAGALLLARQRVAVSLLQREFDLDFEQATALLDQLQAAGLIGPYLGGQRREILMTAEEWERHTAAT